MGVELGLKNAAPGLIIRKRKQFGETEDVVALLRHFRGVQAMDDEVMHSGEGDLTDLCRHKGTRIIVTDVVYCRRMNLKFKSFAFAHFQVTISSSSTKPIVPGQNCAAVKFKNCGVITYPRSIEPHQILMLYYVCRLRAKKITILQWVLMIHSTQQVFGGAAAAVTTSYG
ncbi:hypothetical protein Tco_0448123 [Tanacetum coccineum]